MRSLYIAKRVDLVDPVDKTRDGTVCRSNVVLNARSKTICSALKKTVRLVRRKVTSLKDKIY